MTNDWGNNAKDCDILGYQLKLTCGCFPEQYDVYDEHGEQVGYLRLRHNYFRADVPRCGGSTVYSSREMNGCGEFDDDEREYFLTEAVKAIKEQHEKELEK